MGMGVLCALLEGMVTELLSQLQTEHKVVGIKQSRKALQRGAARRVILAEDAAPQVPAPIRALCESRGIPVTEVSHMRQLGDACGIRLGCAVAAIVAH